MSDSTSVFIKNYRSTRALLLSEWERRDRAVPSECSLFMPDYASCVAWDVECEKIGVSPSHLIAFAKDGPDPVKWVRFCFELCPELLSIAVNPNDPVYLDGTGANDGTPRVMDEVVRRQLMDHIDKYITYRFNDWDGLMEHVSFGGLTVSEIAYKVEKLRGYLTEANNLLQEYERVVGQPYCGRHVEEFESF